MPPSIRNVLAAAMLASLTAAPGAERADSMAARYTTPVKAVAPDLFEAPLAGQAPALIPVYASEHWTQPMPELQRAVLVFHGLQRNADVFRQIVPAVLRATPNARLLVVTNPVDIMTHVAAQYAAAAGVPSTRVLGSGTTLDTARFRALVGRHFDVDPQYVHAYVVGEHGDSEVLVWSQATIAGVGLDAFADIHGTPLTDADRGRIDDNVRHAAYQIIAGKGATYYGIGSAVARIVDVLVHDQRAILTVCSRIAGVPHCDGVTLSLPHLVGGDGVLATIPLSLNDAEREGLRRSAGILRDAAASLTLSS